MYFQRFRYGLFLAHCSFNPYYLYYLLHIIPSEITHRESSAMKFKDRIYIKGAREHNLKNINVEIPRNTLTVITGLSGSGKSSLAFDTIYAEGQRRYVESLSAYARQFLGLMEKARSQQWPPKF